MQRQLAELESVLTMLVAEHRKLLTFTDAQQAAMRSVDLAALDAAVNGQEACRLRITTLEVRRRGLAVQLTKGQRVEQPVTLTKLADLYPQRRQSLFKLRDELRDVASTISNRTKVSSRLAGAVLGHLNTVVRLLAGAVERAGVYTKAGVPRVASRIGIMEAVG
jgi:hypothetical protein